jgi:hypothetical protein
VKQKIAQRDKKLRKYIHEKFRNIGSVRGKKKISLPQFLPVAEAEIQGLLHPAEATLGYFLGWFQSLQLPPNTV